MVADQGFGHDRLMGYCASLGLNDVIRIEPHRTVSHQQQVGLLKHVLKEEGVYRITFKKWETQRQVSLRDHRSANGYGATHI